jgi:hypothetical protein
MIRIVIPGQTRLVKLFPELISDMKKGDHEASVSYAKNLGKTYMFYLTSRYAFSLLCI